MPEPALTPSRRSAPTLELLWQDDASALAILREADGRLTGDGLDAGIPAARDLAQLGTVDGARRLSLRELLALRSNEYPLGGTAKVTLAIVDRARRSLAEGLVHPHLQSGDGRWHALWGATLDEVVRDELDAISDATPAICAEPFDGDTDSFVYDLYGCAVDELARQALDGLPGRVAARKDGGPEAFLSTLHAGDPTLPQSSGYAALERRLSAWVDGGLGHRSRAPWNVGLRLDEREDGGPTRVVVELWLEAADDPTLALPASLLRSGGEDVFAFLRAGDPHGAIRRRVETIAPILADAGIPALDEEAPAAELDHDQVRALLLARCRASRSSGSPCTCRGPGSPRPARCG